MSLLFKPHFLCQVVPEAKPMAKLWLLYFQCILLKEKKNNEADECNASTHQGLQAEALNQAETAVIS
jgi:hypothetical protein